MAECLHCGNPFDPKGGEDRYCCTGCEYVAELIAGEDFGQFYDLKGGSKVPPVRTRPFEEHDFGWVASLVEGAERKAGSGELATMDLGLEGISCVGCVWLVERLFSRRSGAVRAIAHPASGRLHLEWSVGECDVAGFLKELTRFGYVAGPSAGGGDQTERRKLSIRLGLCGGFALNTMAFSLPWYLGMDDGFEFAPLFRMIAFVSATLSMLAGSGYFIGRAWRSYRAGTLHIDTPIALGLLVAYAGSVAGWTMGVETMVYFDFVSTFVFLMLAGRLLQIVAVERNRRRLLERQPVAEDYPLPNAGQAVVALGEIRSGVRFLLGAGLAMPVSGVLCEGSADFSYSWIHGEADPVSVSEGGRLPSGAILLGRTPVLVEADEAWTDSLLFRLAAPVLQERVAPGLDRLLRGYLLAVLCVGLVACLVWGIQGHWFLGMQAMISVFVVSCPCALGVAIPLADDMATSGAGQIGVFVRSSSLWPRMVRVKRLIFDKTGTLTVERPVLANPECLRSLSDEAAAALAWMVRGSLHPIARTLMENLGARGQRLLASQNFAGELTEIPGSGVHWRDGDTTWSLGKSVSDGGSPGGGGIRHGSDLRKNGCLMAHLVFRDELRSGALATMDWLRRAGFDFWILSGDSQEKVDTVARALGMRAEQVQGGLDPEAKAERVGEIGSDDALYLGDGANDSLAFDMAFVAGTPMIDRSLLESKADFFSLNPSLDFVPRLVSLAGARMAAVRAAFVFALIYNLLAVWLAASGKMSPVVAAVLMPLSSVVTLFLVIGIFSRKSAIRH